MRLAFQVAYAGDSFMGSQIQPGLRTVEGEFIAACKRLSLFSDWRGAGFAFAGRTDRGVHAYGQVCAFTTPHAERAVALMNQQLPRDCWCRGWAEVDGMFHPRYAARSRTYRYYFTERELDFPSMAEAARCFTGTHDFSAFARTEGRNPIRTVVNSALKEDGKYMYLEVTGESFLWHMVRGMAGALIGVGERRISAEELEEMLRHGRKQRVPAAPARGLILWDVDCGIGFHPLDPPGRQGSHLKRLEQEHALMVHVLSLIRP